MATAVNSHGGPHGRLDFESETFIAFFCKDHGADAGSVSPPLRAMGHDGSHANAGGQVAVAFDTTQITSPGNYSSPAPGDPCHPLASGAHPPAVYSIMPQNSGKDYKAREVDVAQPVMGSGPTGGNQGGDVVTQPVGGFIHPRQIRNSQSSNQVGIKPFAEITDALTSEGPGATMQHMAVRRLTPRECERLQGFPDDYTLIPYRNKAAEQCPDGNRYKALGNSMAVPVMAWIGRRIEMVAA